MLDSEGFIAEGTGENIFMVKGGRIYTPSLGAILPGVTRLEVIRICRSFGFSIEERKLKLNELKESDELFFTGTAAEITPIVKIDSDIIGEGKAGEISCRLREEFFSYCPG